VIGAQGLPPSGILFTDSTSGAFRASSRQPRDLSAPAARPRVSGKPPESRCIIRQGQASK